MIKEITNLVSIIRPPHADVVSTDHAVDELGVKNSEFFWLRVRLAMIPMAICALLTGLMTAFILGIRMGFFGGG